MDGETRSLYHFPLKTAYRKLVISGQLEEDPAQLELVGKLDQTLEKLVKKRLSSKSSSLGWLFGKNGAQKTAEKGIYIWGGVGRGKSMLMDLFFDALPHKKKKRVHFNDFMQDAQDRIHAHRQKSKNKTTGNHDPIASVASDIAENVSILCFDEFAVTDIADAMILGRLFDALFRKGVSVIATSNVKPENLYKDGLNREIFLPFIDLLLQHLEVVELDARTDFRLEKLNQAPVYYSPLGKNTSKAMNDTWLRLTGVKKGTPESLLVKSRQWQIPETSGGVVRLTFADLCESPRSAADYLALSRRFHTVFIEGIPVMDRKNHNAAKRFILLIDTLYDNHIRIVVSAAAKPEKLYLAKTGTEAFEFKRTVSRIHEMQSQEYIGAGTDLS